MPDESYAEQLEGHRREKDRYFKTDPHSPIPEDERDSFEGLAYYPPDETYRVVAKLDPSNGGTIEIPRTAGDTVTYEKAGDLEIPLPDGTVHVLAFETDDHHGHGHRHLFIPFQDATSGEETYGAGRYLEAHEIEGDRFLVDFNQAYHPFCVYDDAYTCPLPPAENRLDVPVQAGERLPVDEAQSPGQR